MPCATSAPSSPPSAWAARSTSASCWATSLRSSAKAPPWPRPGRRVLAHRLQAGGIAGDEVEGGAPRREEPGDVLRDGRGGAEDEDFLHGVNARGAVDAAPERRGEGGIDVAGEPLPLGVVGSEALRRHQRVLGRVHRAAGLAREAVQPRQQLPRAARRRCAKSIARVTPGRGKDISPGDGTSPNVFSTVRNEPCPLAAMRLEDSRMAPSPCSNGTTHWNWRKPRRP